MNLIAGSLVQDRRDVAAYVAALRRDPCAYCGEPAETTDHIEASSRGGCDHWHNKTGACLSCNVRKGPASVLGFLAVRRGNQVPWDPRELLDQLLAHDGADRLIALWDLVMRRSWREVGA